MTKADREVEHLRKIATPAALGRTIGQDVWGKPYRIDPWLAHYEAKVVSALLSPQKKFVALNTPPQIGKLLALDTPLPTPTGWTTMRDIVAGQEVLGADGLPYPVTYVSPVQHRPVHRLRFDDGSTIDAGPEHLWVTFERVDLKTRTGRRREGNLRTEHHPQWWAWRSPRGKGPQVRTTQELLETLTSSDGVSNHSIPHTAPLALPDVDLPLDPWVFGYWLGNGLRQEPTIITGSRRGDLDHRFVEERLQKAGVEFTLTARGSGVSVYRLLGVIETLRSMGSLGTKAVPGGFLRASPRQRMDLLHGLMDSDGTPETGGMVSFSSKDRHLRDAVAELAVSLGAKVRYRQRRAKLDGRDYGMISYKAEFTPPFCPFSLPRKAARWKPGEITGRAISRHHRHLVSIEVLDEAPMRCISVDSPGNLYLAGKGMVPTHNTSYSGVLVPTWCTGMFPHKQTVFISYSDDYSTSRGKLVREIMERYGMTLFGVGVSRSSAAGGDWKIEGTQGGMLSVGIGSQITGRSGDIVIVDDLIKNMEEATSIATKKKHADEFEGTILTRVQDDSTYLITATRWAEDDLTGYLMEKTSKAGYSGEEWEFINFPAICEPPEDLELSEEDREAYVDMLGRHLGEELKTRFSPGHFLALQRSMDPFIFNCLYQGMPSLREGGMFPPNKWSYYRPGEEPMIVRKVRVWDLAATDGGGDWTVGTLMGRAVNGDLYVLQRERFQRSPELVEAAVRSTARIDGFDVKILIEQERSGSGKSLIDVYRRLLAGHIVEPAKAEGSKESRATPYSSMQGQGRVFLPQDAPWLREWIDEHRKMMGDGRRPRHDDQIDTGAYAALELIEGGSTMMFDPAGLNLQAEAQMRQFLEQGIGNWRTAL
jgi:predicted phage terminase large subunit-like protein